LCRRRAITLKEKTDVFVGVITPRILRVRVLVVLRAFWKGSAMRLPRRRFLHLAAGAAALAAVSRIARAQTYPTRPVRMIVGFPPGGSSSITARIVCQWLSERLGQQFIVENKPGAGTNIAVQAVVTSPHDGYTLLSVSSSNASNATLYESLPFNFLRDIAPIAGTTSFPLVMVVHPSVSARTVAQFIAHAKANPGKISMASFGVGTTGHLTGELFKAMTGVNLVHVPYRGSAPALTDLVGGQVQVMFDVLASSLPHIQSGALRALAVTPSTRADALPDVPTVGDTVPGFEATGWQGVGAPRGTPPEIVDTLNREINAALANPSIKARLADLGYTPILSTPAQFGKLVAEETEKWGTVIRTANIKPE
jgi:tripartite-type tricarboxylate transporter receptor subunit TctC